VLADDVDLEAIGKNEKCAHFTGADLAALVREAGILCLQEYITSNELNKKLAIQSKHFDDAMMKIRPSVSAEVFSYIMYFFFNFYEKQYYI
jgi:SpoVK/Ycf46/Vps4 family AAA+-type ATPase